MIDRLPGRSICPPRKMQILTLREYPTETHQRAGAALLMSHFKKVKPAFSCYPTVNYRELFLSHFPVTLRDFS